MPMYTFECAKCQVNFEELVLPREIPLLDEGKYNATCPLCGAAGTKVMSKVNFTTKSGRGFYGSKPKA